MGIMSTSFANSLRRCTVCNEETLELYLNQINMYLFADYGFILLYQGSGEGHEAYFYRRRHNRKRLRTSATRQDSELVTLPAQGRGESVLEAEMVRCDPCFITAVESAIAGAASLRLEAVRFMENQKRMIRRSGREILSR